MGGRDFKYDAFLSYSHKDTRLVRYVQFILERLANWIDGDGTKHKLKVFRDKTHLPLGDLSEKIKEGLKKSRNLIVFCSDAANNSEWVYKEIEYFYTEFIPESQSEEDQFLSHILFVGCEKDSRKNKQIIDDLLEKALKNKVKRQELKEILRKAKDSLYADFGSAKGSFLGGKKRTEAYRLAASLFGKEADLDDVTKRSEIFLAKMFGISLLLLAAAVFGFGFGISNYHIRRDRDARRLALVAEAQLEEGNRLLAAQLALSTTERKKLYRTIMPEAVSVLSDAAHICVSPSDQYLEQEEDYQIYYSNYLSMDVSEDGRYIVAANDNGVVFGWDTENGEKLWELYDGSQKFLRKAKIIGNEKVIFYELGGCDCYNLTDAKLLWSIKFPLSYEILHFSYSDMESLQYILDTKQGDGLMNLTEVEREGEKELFFVERQGGLTLRDEKTGEIRAQIKREDIEQILPDGVSYCKDINYHPVRLVTWDLEPHDIGYDTGNDLFLLPCYGEMTVSQPDESSWTETYYPGVLEWKPQSGEIKYVALEQPAADDGTEVNGTEELLYPCSGIIMKSIETVDDQLILCAFDADSGKQLWNHTYKDYEHGVSVRNCIRYSGTDLVIINGDKLDILDPMNGDETHIIQADLHYNEHLAMILNGEESYTRNDSETGALQLLTTEGRLCSLRDGELLVGRQSQTFFEETLSWMNNSRYIRAEDSYTGTGRVFVAEKNRIRQYGIGLDNDLYTELFTEKTDTLGADGVKVYPVNEDHILVKDLDKTWKFYYIAGNDIQLLWSRTPADIKKDLKQVGFPDSLEDSIKWLSYVGIDSGSGKILLYGTDLNGFIELDPQFGELSFIAIPTSLPGKIKSPKITENGFCYINESAVEDTITCSFIFCDGVSYDYQEIGLGEMSKDNNITSPIDLVMAPNGRYGVITGFTEGPFLVDIREKEVKQLDYRISDRNLKPEVLLIDNPNEATCSFDSKGRYFAVNIPALNRIDICDMSGKVVHTMDYFNAVISGMVFSDKNLLTVTYDGRVMSTRLKDMKLLNTTTLPGNGTNCCLVKADQDHLWIKDSLDTVYRVDVDSLSCRQKIDNTIAIDPVNEWSYIYELTGGKDISNANLTVGRVPLLTDQEIIDKAKEYIGGRTISKEEQVYFGTR